jgi:hypothetical protein
MKELAWKMKCCYPPPMGGLINLVLLERGWLFLKFLCILGSFLQETNKEITKKFKKRLGEKYGFIIIFDFRWILMNCVVIYENWFFGFFWEPCLWIWWTTLITIRVYFCFLKPSIIDFYQCYVIIWIYNALLAKDLKLLEYIFTFDTWMLDNYFILNFIFTNRK